MNMTDRVNIEKELGIQNVSVRLLTLSASAARSVVNVSPPSISMQLSFLINFYTLLFVFLKEMKQKVSSWMQHWCTDLSAGDSRHNPHILFSCRQVMRKVSSACYSRWTAYQKCYIGSLAERFLSNVSSSERTGVCVEGLNWNQTNSDGTRIECNLNQYWHKRIEIPRQDYRSKK